MVCGPMLATKVKKNYEETAESGQFWRSTMLEIDTRLRVARGIAKTETEASVKVFETLKERGHPEGPPPTAARCRRRPGRCRRHHQDRRAGAAEGRAENRGADRLAGLALEGHGIAVEGGGRVFHRPRNVEEDGRDGAPVHAGHVNDAVEHDRVLGRQPRD